MQTKATYLLTLVVSISDESFFLLTRIPIPIPVFPAHVPPRTLHHPANPLYSIIILSHPFSTPSMRAISITEPRLWNGLPSRACFKKNSSLHNAHLYRNISFMMTFYMPHQKLTCTQNPVKNFISSVK